MKRKKLIACLTLIVMAANAQDSKIYVDMGSKGNDVPKTMYGIFFEEINHAGDGGLYGEMLKNRSFEEHVLPSGFTYTDGMAVAPRCKNYYTQQMQDFSFPWEMAKKKFEGWSFRSSKCDLSREVVEMESPLHENTPNALRLTVTNTAKGSSIQVRNTGYWGVSVKAGNSYKLRFYMRTSSPIGKVNAMVCASDGTKSGETTIETKNDGVWNEYTAVMTTEKTISSGTFCLEFSTETDAVIDLDYVSLFPCDTYKDRENGMRRDVAEMLEGLNPGFMRWPGGCIVEGISLENAVKWKETLGDPMQRKGEYDLWGYRNTYGFGYHEFLQLCEDMGMDGMFVANVGMACCIRSNAPYVPSTDYERLKQFRDDIIDAIEYAIGDPATNEWAARRAAAGHPEPFPLKYVELGNENGTERYASRFAYFYDELKRLYPDITFINTLSWTDHDWASKHYVKTDMYDPHWYVKPDYFYNAADMFDTAPRGDYKIYAGEYATNDGVGSGNMEAALSEACFIGAMERNSDFVTMASYAPLLTNVNAPNWYCNLIWLDNERVMGRASYYIQQLYAANRPDYNVKTRLFSDRQNLVTKGRIGLGTWNTQAEYRNLKVSCNDGSEVYYTSDFAGNLNEWTEGKGEWNTTDEGNYAQTASGSPCISMLNSWLFNNCTIEVEAKKTGGQEGFLVLFANPQTTLSDYYQVNIGGWNNTLAAIEKVTGGNGTVKSGQVGCRIENDRWYKIKVVMRETSDVTVYLDDNEILTMPLNDIIGGRLQAFGGYDTANGEIVMKVVNAEEREMTADICINGKNIAKTGKVTTLMAESLDSENSMDNPEAISPVESTFDGFAETFSYTFSPCSFTIFRIKVDATADNTLDIPKYEWNSTPEYLDTADKLLASLRSEILLAATKAEALIVERADGADILSRAILSARTNANLATATIKDLTKVKDDLEVAVATYMEGLQTTENDCTVKIENADFKSMSTDGWMGSKPSLESNVGEFFNCTFDCYQTLTGLKPGKYLFSVQAFYREGLHDEAYAAHVAGTETLNAMMYASDAETPIRSIYDQKFDSGSWNGYLDLRWQAEKAFAESQHTLANYLICEVGDDGTLRLGLKKDNGVVNDWTCFNNFRLHYIPQIQTGINMQKLHKQHGRRYDLRGMGNDKTRQHGIVITDGKKFVE